MSGPSNNVIRCGICPKACRIPPGFSGECRVRMNLDGRLMAVTYARPCAVHVDPMEKKPLFHFCPGAAILSLGSAGCNLHCKHCQNADMSQGNPEDITAFALPPDELAALAKKQGCAHVAYTYNEPLVNYEYVRDCCIAARASGLRNVLVTAGYIREKPLAALLPYVDAANVDIKGFSEAFYREVCEASLAPVLASVLQMIRARVHVEITNLVIPTLNDSDDMLDGLFEWIAENAGREIPLHLSRFFPSFRMTHLPPTPLATLLRARDRAKAAGLKHVYVGNAEVPDGDDTFCAGCGTRLVTRQRYVVTVNRVKPDGGCPECGRRVYGVWS
ncbi:MAG TPA: AmmeMemoRadiSam system radical SAM enzyme [Kiritimatiellia bacterium]|nr:AmmeMemoRadiSam system radical SAM enzyme [Kiritimatiellia bacterium]HRU70033.1 AmmeMemoRadiSam system radical SAM enzyme [Kiritimatiellia bacterium]